MTPLELLLSCNFQISHPLVAKRDAKENFHHDRAERSAMDSGRMVKEGLGEQVTVV